MDQELPNTAPINSEEINTEKTINSVDHHTLSKKELVARLKYLLDNFELGQLKGEVELIRSAFYIQHNKEQAVLKQNFLNEGGLEVDYLAPVDEYENALKELFNLYRDRKATYFHKLEKIREEGLIEKHRIIEEIKGLITKDESLAKTFEEFNSLQQRWRDSGVIPHAQATNLWETYQHHVENFYDYIKINKELRDLDFKKNLEQKISLCERAENLINTHSAVSAFNELQDLHKQWREIGPVSREIREELWARFKAVSATINKNNQKHYEDLREEQKKCIEEKVAICEQIERINEEVIESASDWNKKSNDVLKLQTLWKELKPLPRQITEKIYKRFRMACDTFFDKKREFYNTYKKTQDDNLLLKQALCEKAESLQESDDWVAASNIFVNIQKEWKTIGPVHRKQSDIVWTRFRKACNHFFERKNAHFATGEDDQNENLKSKNILLEEIRSYEPVADLESNQLMITSYNDRWKKIGHVPFNQKEKIQTQFREAIDNIFNQLDLSDEQKEQQIQISRFEEMLHLPDAEKRLDAERTKIANKLKELEADIKIWENNIGFFSSSNSKSNNMLDGFQKKIEEGKDRIIKLKAKLKLINQQFKKL